MRTLLHSAALMRILRKLRGLCSSGMRKINDNPEFLKAHGFIIRKYHSLLQVVGLDESCPSCGSTLPLKAKYCLECGYSVSSLSGAETNRSLGDMRTLPAKRPSHAGGESPAPSIGDAQTLLPNQPQPAETSSTHENIDDKKSKNTINHSSTIRVAEQCDDLPSVQLSHRYVLHDEIGRGGFAIVWKAEDRKLGRTVAVKRLLTNHQTGRIAGQTLARFRREAQAIASLNHRNIAAVYDHDHDDEGDYIVMEYVEGGTLQEYLKLNGGSLAVDEAIRLIKSIAQGLGYAHRKNLVHRDIKPANILIQPDGDELIPKIVDFGLARQGSDSELSMSGYGMGTPWYMPPEQRRDAKSVNHTADIYALGKILYELISGDVPDNVDPEKIPNVKGLADIIFRCIKSNPEERYFSTVDLQAALASLSGKATTEPQNVNKGNGCISCGTENSPDVRFCESCGAGLIRECPECGRDNSVRKQYCGACGSDVNAFEQWVEAFAKMKTFARERSWSRVEKEYALLQQDAKISGKKGQALRDQVDAFVRTIHEKSCEIAALKSKITAADKDLISEELLADCKRYLALVPDDTWAKERHNDLQLHLEHAAWQRISKEAKARNNEESLGASLALYDSYLQQYPEGEHADDAYAAKSELNRVIAAKSLVAKALDCFTRAQYQKCVEVCDTLLTSGDFTIDSDSFSGSCKDLRASALSYDADLEAENQQMLAAYREHNWPLVMEISTALLKRVPTHRIAKRCSRNARYHLKLNKYIGVLFRFTMACIAIIVLLLLLFVLGRESWQHARHRRGMNLAQQAILATDFDLAEEHYHQLRDLRELMFIKPQLYEADKVLEILAIRNIANQNLKEAQEQEGGGDSGDAHDHLVKAYEYLLKGDNYLVALDYMAAYEVYSALGKQVILPSETIDEPDLHLENIDDHTAPDFVIAEERSPNLIGAARAVTPQLPGTELMVPLSDGVDLTLVWIPTGSYTRGSPVHEPGRKDDEDQHQVYITTGYWMGKYPVTQAQWTLVMGENPSHIKGEQHPVENVSWFDSQSFLVKLNRLVADKHFRLPTEAEWEYACRAESEAAFSFGEGLNASHANFGFVYSLFRDSADDAHNGTTPVGSFQSNAWGLYDMHGNVWEWCKDWYGAYPSKDTTDPSGPTTGDLRILRGGDWVHDSRHSRSANRHRRDPETRELNIGLRVVMDD